jgi:hypothetical protein
MSILFLKTIYQMGLSSSAFRSSQANFHRIVPRAVVTPISHITLPVTSEIQENFHIEYMHTTTNLEIYDVSWATIQTFVTDLTYL